MKVDVNPIFSWETSQDTEGEPVIYDLYLDTNEEPNTLYATDLTDSCFKITRRLLDFRLKNFLELAVK